MRRLTLDRHEISDECGHCGERFTVSRGSVYEGGSPFGIFLAAMHSCDSPERTAHLAVGVVGERENRSSAMMAWVEGEEYRMSFVDAADSPWKDEEYLDLADPLKKDFLLLAEAVLTEDPAVSHYLSQG